MRRTALSIGAGAGMASFAMNFWWPFLPLYLRQLGASSDAEALFWMGIATSTQGFARLVSGPIWGVLADRFGRKLMFVRSLYAASLTTVIAAVATEPWHIVVALSAQGLLSGFIPAAVALTSVSVPDRDLNRSLGTVTGAQFLGGTLGPSAGALLAAWLGYRGAIWISAALPAVAATWVAVAVVRDRISSSAGQGHRIAEGRRPRGAMLRQFDATFYVAVFLYFGFFALNQFVRVATPIALKELGDEASARSAAGLSFSLAGAASVVGVVGIARMAPGRWSLRSTLVGFCFGAAAANALLGAAGGIPSYIAVFTVISLINAASMPATNTLIAMSADHSVRGTAFGLASSAQAVAFVVGPMGAAAFAAYSLQAGFVVVGSCFVALAAIARFGIRDRAVAPEGAATPGLP